MEWPEFTRESREYLKLAEQSQVLSEPPEKVEDYFFWMDEFVDVAIRVDTQNELTNLQHDSKCYTSNVFWAEG